MLSLLLLGNVFGAAPEPALAAATSQQPGNSSGGGASAPSATTIDWSTMSKADLGNMLIAAGKLGLIPQAQTKSLDDYYTDLNKNPKSGALEMVRAMRATKTYDTLGKEFALNHDAVDDKVIDAMANAEQRAREALDLADRRQKAYEALHTGTNSFVGDVVKLQNVSHTDVLAALGKQQDPNKAFDAIIQANQVQVAPSNTAAQRLQDLQALAPIVVDSNIKTQLDTLLVGGNQPANLFDALKKKCTVNKIVMTDDAMKDQIKLYYDAKQREQDLKDAQDAVTQENAVNASISGAVTSAFITPVIN